MMGPNLSYRSKIIILLAVSLAFLSSCRVVVLDYPRDKPFVYETDIRLHGELQPDERKELDSKLREQLHDSIIVRRISKPITTDEKLRLFYIQQKRPPVYDSINAEKSVEFLRALLHSGGYYRDSVNFSDTVILKGDQQRAFITFHVFPGKQFKFDSISVRLNDTTAKRNTDTLKNALDTLQKITLMEQEGSLIKKGKAFSKPLIASEFDRLTDIYRNNGFLRFSRNELLAVWDTVGSAFLRPTIDPLEQAELLEALQRRRENPTADVEIRLRSTKDSSHLIRYYVGHITIYPDFNGDTTQTYSRRTERRNFTVLENGNFIRHRVLGQNLYLRRGTLYDQRNHLKTQNRFNALGAWRLVNVEPVPRPGTDTVDFVVKLNPADKYNFEFNIEGSQNLGGPFSGGNLIGVNLSLLNRNFQRAANQSATTVGFGTEFNAGSILQTIQVNAGQTISFPRLIIPFTRPTRHENARTSLGLNARYIKRLNYLDLLAVTGTWGYDLSWKNTLLNLRFPNLEYNFLDRGPILDTLIKYNQSYKYIFNDGLISSTIAGLTIRGGKDKTVRVFRVNTELSGLLLGLYKTEFLKNTLKRYIKLDLDLRSSYKLMPRSEFAWRLFAGAGYSFIYDRFDSTRFHLPFFKSYSAGGSNSMRAWTVRRLGPGSSVKSFDRDSFPDRFGDMQLEANAEYRFFVAEVNGIRLNSALFTDIGNVWYLRKNPVFPGGEFHFNKLWDDLAVAVGTGLRVDFGFINIRLDYAFKAKDPSPANPAAQNKWFYKFKPLEGTLQLGIDYPF